MQLRSRLQTKSKLTGLKRTVSLRSTFDGKECKGKSLSVKLKDQSKVSEAYRTHTVHIDGLVMTPPAKTSKATTAPSRFMLT